MKINTNFGTKGMFELNKYERFIVYPLLLIALFCSVGDNFASSASDVIDKITAREVCIVNEKGNIVMSLSSNEGGGVLVISPGDLISGGIVMTTSTSRNAITVFDPDRNPAITLEGFNKSLNNAHSINVFNDKGSKGVGVAGGNKETGGIVLCFNEYGIPLVAIAKDTNGHGAVAVYDKYGEACKVHSFR